MCGIIVHHKATHIVRGNLPLIGRAVFKRVRARGRFFALGHHRRAVVHVIGPHVGHWEGGAAGGGAGGGREQGRGAGAGEGTEEGEEGKE